MSTRRHVLHTLGALGLAGGAGVATGAAPTLPRPASLADELARALARKQALVLMVSLHGCPFCKLVRESYLVPLRAAGQPVVQVELEEGIPLRDLRGRESTHARFTRERDVRLAPTVLFLGRDGEEVAKRLVGVASVDFFGAYLQERVETANRAVAG